MANLFNDDFQDFLKALNENEVEYVLVGGYSVILHGYSRTTGDMDILVNKTTENYQKLTRAFRQFRMPVFDMTEANFLTNPRFDVFTFGRPPVSIDVMTALKGLAFDEAYRNSKLIEFEGLLIRLIQYADLLKVKQAAGRSRDLNDIEQLKKRNS